MVSTALYTGLSGLRVHQTYIDVIGNNLANVSTPGFRGSRATFSDILSFTVRSGSGPSGTFGGINPIQIGTGSIMATVDTDLNQGTLQDTGRTLDVALQGRGFFTLTNGTQSFYSRVGSFGIDANRTLVDLRTGLRVVGSNGSSITVPTSDTLPARQSNTIAFQGNLPARVTGPLEEIVQSSTPLEQGTPASQVATPPATTAPLYDLTAFAGKTLLVSVNGGAQQRVDFPIGNFGAPPLGPGPVPASAIAAQFVTSTGQPIAGLSVVADDATGSIRFDTVRLGGEAKLKFDDGSGAAGLLARLGLSALQERGTAQAATETTNLNALTSRNAPYQPGDGITVRGTNPDGSPFSNTFVFGTTGTTVGDLINFINATADNTQATASLTAEGNIRLSARNKEEADLSLFIGDGTGTIGSSSWANFVVSQNGAGPDEATTPIDVVDSQGRTHQVTMTFVRSTADPTIWDMTAAIDPTEGTLVQGSISQIRFNDDGSFNVIGGGTNALTFAWNGIAAAQNVTVNFGTSGTFDGVAQLGNATTVVAIDEDGYAAGTLLNVGFDTTGDLVGVYSNGQNRSLAQLRISMFSNEGGLVRTGDTLFTESPNSDDAIATVANTAGAGSVRSGQLENSNVDIAREFVNLIEAQRGFQANSRVITTTDEILAELMNIVR